MCGLIPCARRWVAHLTEPCSRRGGEGGDSSGFARRHRLPVMRSHIFALLLVLLSCLSLKNRHACLHDVG